MAISGGVFPPPTSTAGPTTRGPFTEPKPRCRVVRLAGKRHCDGECFCSASCAQLATVGSSRMRPTIHDLTDLINFP
jgi:hypothetical protein